MLGAVVESHRLCFSKCEQRCQATEKLRYDYVTSVAEDAAFTIATMPDFTASGSRNHDSTIIRNLASSNGRFSAFWCTHWYTHESGVITTRGGESGCGDVGPVLKTGIVAVSVCYAEFDR